MEIYKNYTAGESSPTCVDKSAKIEQLVIGTKLLIDQYRP